MMKMKMKMMKLNQGDDMEHFMNRLELEFEALVESGEDIRSYLYLPHHYLTSKVKRKLDEYLMDEAYRQIDLGTINKDSFIVYKDDLITVKLDKTEQRVDLLERLLVYFTSKEEYEKCVKVQNLLKQLQ